MSKAEFSGVEGMIMQFLRVSLPGPRIAASDIDAWLPEEITRTETYQAIGHLDLLGIVTTHHDHRGEMYITGITPSE